MQPQDQFDQQFNTLVATLSAWTEGLQSCAEVSSEQNGDFWRLRLDPHLPTACPVEVIVHRSQTYDIMIGPEAYEGLTLQRFSGIQPMLEAVVRGCVTTLTTRSAATNSTIGFETVLTNGANELWRQSRPAQPADARAPTDTVISTRHYPPYRRA